MSRFDLLHQDAGSAARRGRLTLAHGAVETPAFMPVATHGSIKGLTPVEIRATGAEMILSNAYHLWLRPGCDVIEGVGGLHRFIGWDGPILTDSGGYQIFSLAALARITDDGVTFRSHIDGSTHALTPEDVIRAQERLGSDVAMILDECPPGDADRTTSPPPPNARPNGPSGPSPPERGPTKPSSGSCKAAPTWTFASRARAPWCRSGSTATPWVASRSVNPGPTPGG